MRVGILLLILISTLSCANEHNRTTQRATSPEYSLKDTLDYTYHTKKEISSYFVGDSVRTDTAYYKITYPVFGNTQIDQALHGSIFIEHENNAEEGARAFLDGYNEFVEENSTTYVNAVWYKDANSKIILNTPLFLTLRTSIDEYTGGAHGNHLTFFSVFDLDLSKKMELTDLIATDKLKDLTKLAEKHFRRKENLSDTSNLAKDFFFPDGIFALNDNFGLTKEKLIIYYNEYEIRPYAEGITTIEIPYQEVLEMLNARAKRYIKSIQ
ncbi:DUF3298 and DUF4163 domain-containing protein [Sphingobacterium paucimobilis]|uniref:DUF3298 domain-containing protein n=1 Tax=Sphingobacterium paucimobilis HER1398 TaxID=1346330 RepID=U2IX20_9SPHI|nr:DUF3298 and DUF4163 domain-containing protein [Sphingobacterium paucimobilis]ERJ57244.1 hypothetical protein M472_00545 [Sphingobacterium paucimobilis HER1398]